MERGEGILWILTVQKILVLYKYLVHMCPMYNYGYLYLWNEMGMHMKMMGKYVRYENMKI
jgi:hypothetical protein